MMAALKYEWTRLWTVRSTYIMLGLALLLSAALSFLIVLATQSETSDPNQGGPPPGTLDWFTSFSAPMTFAAVLASVLGAQAMGQEYRFGLIRLTLTEFPNRITIFLAKTVMVVLAAALIALVSYLGSWIGLALHGMPTPPTGVTVPDATFFARGIVFVVLWALSSFALAGITRQTAIGIAVPIVSGLIVENVLIGFFSEKATWLVEHLPWSSASRWAGSSDFVQGPSGWSGLGVFAVWVAVFFIVELVLFMRRDA
jgi:ABC-type transport system involved in multi-copper enzyme maturation permease subunit